MNTSVKANPKYMRDVIAVHGLVDSGLEATPSVKRTPTTESLDELEIDKRAVCQDSRGKAVVHVPGARRHQSQREGNSTKDPLSHFERRDEREAQHSKLERRLRRNVPERNHHIPAVRERVHRQRLGKLAYDLQDRKLWSCAL